MLRLQNPKLNESFWSMSVTRTSPARDSESRVASSRPAKPAPRITTCFTVNDDNAQTPAAATRGSGRRCGSALRSGFSAGLSPPDELIRVQCDPDGGDE